MSQSGKQSPLGVNVNGSLLQNVGFYINPVAQGYMGTSKTNTDYTMGTVVGGTCLRLLAYAINDAYTRGVLGTSTYDNLISIGIHHHVNSSLLKIFLNNFIWKGELICIETICNFEKQIQYLSNDKSTPTNVGAATPINDDKDTTIIKKIVKTKVSDIYNVSNMETSDSEGILYVSTLKMSKHLNGVFKDTEELHLKCKFNKHFQKWALVC